MYTRDQQAGNRRRRWELAVVMALGIVGMAVGPALDGAASAARPQAAVRAGQPGGDIPDSAVYLRYQGKGMSIEYVEGWLQTTGKQGVTFSDKDSSVVVELRPRLRGLLATYVQQVDLPRLAHTAGYKRGGLSHDTIAGIPALHLTYRGRSAPDEVTGKTVAVQTDRYYVPGARGLAVLTLSTPVGVDNVDGFRRIAHSFRFR